MIIQIVLAAVIFASGVVGGIKWHAGIIASRDLIAQKDAQRKSELRTEVVDKSAVKFEQYKARVEIREVEVLKEVTRVVEKPVYSNVCLDDDGLLIIATDIAARNTPSQPAPAVPAPARAVEGRWQNHSSMDTRNNPAL